MTQPPGTGAPPVAPAAREAALTPRIARVVARAAPPARAYRRVPAVAAAAAMAVGATVLAGWAFDAPALRQMAPGLIPMLPNTAVTVALLGVALWLLRPRAAADGAGRADAAPGARAAAQACAGAVLLLALLVGAEWVLGRDLGADRVLFRRLVSAPGAPTPPGRMAVNTVITLAALAASLLLMDVRWPARQTAAGRLGRRLRGGCAAVGTLVPYFALVGYVYGVRRLYDPAGLFAGMAANTAAALTLLGVGVTLARPERGLARLLTGDDAGGLLLRRALPVAVVLPAVLGLVRLVGEDRGLFPDRAGTAMLVLALTLVMSTSLVRAAVRARALDAARAGSLAAAEAAAAALTEQAAAREAATAAVAAREAELRQMANNLPQLAWMADAGGWIFWYNRRWYDYTGTTFDAMQGWGWKAVQHPDHVDRVVAGFQAALAAGVPWEDTFPLRSKDGEWRWFLSRANPIRDTGVPDAFTTHGDVTPGPVVRWFGTNTDITAQRRLEAEREGLLAAERAAREQAERARAEAEAASRAKSQFLATMSHELRTPLNAIGGHVQLVEMGIHGPVTEAQADALARVNRAQRHLLGLINDVLNLARIEAGRVDYALADVPVAELVGDVASLVGSQLAGKGLAFAVELPDAEVAPGVPVLVARADREKAAQVLVNLLGNAVKFTPAGGRVTVEGRAGEDAAGLPVVELHVRDTGVGIAADQLARIFEPFVQVDGGLTRTAEGTGLGLAISRDLARGMGGDLTVRSVAGHGSVFTLTLPRVLAPEADGDRRTGAERRDGQRREVDDRRAGEERRDDEDGSGALPAPLTPGLTLGHG
jgi:PAS domain S-box-containing protein